MGYENVSIMWDCVPLLSDFRASLKIESPIVEPGLPGGAIKPQAVAPETLIHQQDDLPVLTHLPGQLRLFLEEEIMVPWDEDLELMLLFG
jgi:hypothetical protein